MRFLLYMILCLILCTSCASTVSNKKEEAISNILYFPEGMWYEYEYSPSSPPPLSSPNTIE